jgi:micrococcal nuclease
MPHRALLRLIALIVLAWVAPARAEDFTGKVVGVTDGDTLTVLRDRTPLKVRLHGIDCPESGQDFGSRAKQATSEMAFGKVVSVRPIDTDRYGRTVALVVLPDGRTLNHELVRQGLAWWYRHYAPGDVTLERLESGARQARIGIWSQPSPVAPWDWRGNTGLPAALANQVVRLVRSARRRCGIVVPDQTPTRQIPPVTIRTDFSVWGSSASYYRPE